MGKKLNKVLVWTVILVLMFSVFSCSVSEDDTWTCPNCGKDGLMRNFCPSCGTARPEDPGIPFEYEIGDVVAFASQEYADTADKLVWTVAAIDGEMVALVCVSTLPEMVVSLMDSDTPGDAAEFVKHILLKKLLSEGEAAVISEMGDFMISDCASFANLPIDKDGKCLVLIVKSSKIAPFLTLTEYVEEPADDASAPVTAASTVTPTLRPETAAPKTQPATAAPTKKPATAVPTVQPTATVAPVVTPTPTAAPTPAYGHPHSDLSGILSIDNQGVAGHGRICHVCNAVVGFAVHTYPESWTEDIAPSCTSQGREKKACTVCGYTIYQRIEPNGVHKLGLMEAVNYKGVNGHGQQCSVCLQYINFAAHTYPEVWTADIAPSCTSQGREKKACTVCGSLLYQWIDPTGHHYVDGFCSACGKKEP